MVDYYSEAGEHHNYDINNNQDVIVHKCNGKYTVISLADGISECKKARSGADTACSSSSEFLLKYADDLFFMNETEIANRIISNLQCKLMKLSEKESVPFEEYSSTLSCVLIENRTGRMYFFSVGDGLILGCENEKIKVLAMPSDSRNGCFATTTYKAADYSKSGFDNVKDLNSVLICSDGAWRIMYDRNRMKKEFKNVMLDQNNSDLKKMLYNSKRYDDCSFISLNLK
jgi:hypothetical protein